MDNEPCEPQINASLGKDFTITLKSNPSTGFELGTKFYPNYLSILSSAYINGNENEKSRMLGVPGKDDFFSTPEIQVNTEVIMLLLKARENGTVAERKIFPMNIMSAAVSPKQAIMLGKNVNPEPELTAPKTSLQRPTENW